MSLTQDKLQEALSYDPDTGEFMWKLRSADRIKVGDVAGSLKANGYIGIQICGKLYKAHRLAWLYTHGSWPSDQIDHINCVKHDNRINNLREATQSQNLADRPAWRDGLKGASFNKHANKWHASIQKDGHSSHLGYFTSEEEANCAYAGAARQLHGEFARA